MGPFVLFDTAGGRDELRQLVDPVLRDLVDELEPVELPAAWGHSALVAKHAGSVRAEVEVEHVPGRLRIHVVDQGRGFDPRLLELPGESGSGLRGMRERAQLFGGVLRVDSGPGGTRIDVGVPL